jgi:hypothetical protein
MKIVGVVLVLVVILVGFWTCGMSYSLNVGATAANPLGDFEKLDKALVAKGLAKSAGDRAEAQNLFNEKFAITDTMTTHAYLDHVPGMKAQVIVVRGADGKVAAVLSRFRSGALSFSKTGTAAENFTALYWIGLATAEPVLTKQDEGGSDRREYLYAQFAKGGATGSWKKEGASATLRLPQEIADTVTFVAR